LVGQLHQFGVIGSLIGWRSPATAMITAILVRVRLAG
jgi:hypothetical protein